MILELERAVQKLVGIIAICLLTNSLARADEGARVDSMGRYPQLRSVLLQAEVAPFIVGFGGLIDYDFVRFPSQHLSTFGVRISVDHYKFGGPGGEDSDSPALDYNILLRHTASGSVVRFDIYLGYCHYSKKNTDYLKFGIDIQFAIIDHFWSLLAKLSLPAGIGFSAGWQK